MHVISLATPVKFLWKKGTQLEKTYVFRVPPGRWVILFGGTLLMGGSTSLCMGAPGFEVGEGEAVFAGTYTARNDDIYVGRVNDMLKPDVDLAPVRAALGPSRLADRLKPAAYMNGHTWDCGLGFPSFAYRYEMPDVPSVDPAEAALPR